MSRSDPDGDGIWEHLDFAPKEDWNVPPYSGSPDYDYWNSNKRDGEWEDERPWKYQRTDDWYGEWTSDVPFGPEPMPAWYLPDDWEDNWDFQYDSQSPTYQEAENALNAWLNAPVPTYQSPIPGYESPDINWDDAFNQIMDLDYTFRPISPESSEGSPMSWIEEYTGTNPDPSAPPHWMDDDWMDWENTANTSGENSWLWDLFSEAAGALGGSTLGRAALGGLGAAAGKGIFNVLTGNGPIRRRRERERQAAAGASGKPGGCSCGDEKPQYTCEEKCAYGRMMAEKCMGCRGYSGKAPGGYRRSYSSYPYRSTGNTPALPYGGSKPRVAGRQYRRSMRQTARQTRRTMRTAARQTRRTNRQARRAARGPLIGRFRR